jgi:hypothetical protein
MLTTAAITSARDIRRTRKNWSPLVEGNTPMRRSGHNRNRLLASRAREKPVLASYRY